MRNVKGTPTSTSRRNLAEQQERGNNNSKAPFDPMKMEIEVPNMLVDNKDRWGNIGGDKTRAPRDRSPSPAARMRRQHPHQQTDFVGGVGVGVGAGGGHVGIHRSPSARKFAEAAAPQMYANAFLAKSPKSHSQSTTALQSLLQKGSSTVGALSDLKSVGARSATARSVQSEQQHVPSQRLTLSSSSMEFNMDSGNNEVSMARLKEDDFERQPIGRTVSSRMRLAGITTEQLQVLKSVGLDILEKP